MLLVAVLLLPRYDPRVKCRWSALCPAAARNDDSREISQSILERLKRGQRDGDVPKTAPIVTLAAYYATVLHGLAFQPRDAPRARRSRRLWISPWAGWQQMV